MGWGTALDAPSTSGRWLNRWLRGLPHHAARPAVGAAFRSGSAVIMIRSPTTASRTERSKAERRSGNQETGRHAGVGQGLRRATWVPALQPARARLRPG